jgi:hypothetical protein
MSIVENRIAWVACSAMAVALLVWGFQAGGDEWALPGLMVRDEEASKGPKAGLDVPQSGLPSPAPVRIRLEDAWLILRPSSKVPDRRIEGLRCATWGPKGLAPTGFPCRLESGVVVVPSAPRLGPERICLVADGHAPLDVTELVGRGGAHDCVLEAAMRVDVVLKDLTGMPAPDVELGLTDQRAPQVPKLKIWPVVVDRSGLRFDLAKGNYSMDLGDDSIAVWSGGEPVVVEDLAPQMRIVTLVGLVASAVRFPRAVASTFSVEHYPDGLITVHEEQIIGAARHVRRLFDPKVMVRFAATRSLAQRLIPHDATAKMSPGGRESTVCAVTFQPIDRLVPQDVVLEVTPTAGQIRVRIMRPTGDVLRGAEIRLHHAHGKRKGELAAVVDSGDEWSPIAPGTYFAKTRLPAGCLRSEAVQFEVARGGTAEIEMSLAKDLIAADLRIELQGGGMPQGVTVRIRGEGHEAVYSSRKPERVRIWVPPSKMAAEVFVTDRAHATEKPDVAVELDFANGTLHTITVPSR